MMGSTPAHATATTDATTLAGLSTMVVTASDGVSHAAREDRSGEALGRLLTNRGAQVARQVVADEVDEIVAAVRTAVADGAGLVVVTGGTGLGPRDVTPEALATLDGRVVPGFGEVMRATGRASTPMADLSRSLATTIDQALVLGVPGSPAGAVESVEAVVDLVPHVLDLLRGDTEHGQGTDEADHSPAVTPAPGHEQDGDEQDGHDHERHDHAHDDHVHDASCALAHGDGDSGHHGTLMAVFASPLAAVLLAWGRECGWDTVLVDPERAAAGDTGSEGLRIVADASDADATTDVVVTDHHRDELVDVLDGALDTPARFIGLMGSARHEGPHVQPLRDRGRSEDDLDRIVRPIGLDIGSKTPPEIAVATLADLIARVRSTQPA